jgi:hypothetical protein
MRPEGTLEILGVARARAARATSDKTSAARLEQII